MRSAAIVLMLLGAGVSATPDAAEIQIPRWVVSGGADASSSPAHTLQGTVGQPAVGLLTGSGQLHQVGFWAAWLSIPAELDDPAEALPATFALGACAPNPVRSTARVSYALPREARVALDLYDVRGRLVRRLVAATMPAGFHHTVLDAKGLPASVYFCRLHAGTFVQTRTLVLVK